MNEVKLLATAGALAVVVTLAGCGSTSAGRDLGATSTPTASTAATSTGGAGAPAVGPHDDADVMFVQMMIPHHRQAVEMADMIATKQGIDAPVARLATEIKAAQAPEIDQMTGWLTGWGQSASPSMPMDQDMRGTMSQSEMDDLDRATGDQASALFLTGMIAHHQGAIAMATDELAHGQNPDAKRLAQSIKASQQVEIDTMSELIKKY